MTNFGTEPHKLHRVNSPDTSKVAAYSVDSKKLEQTVFEVVQSFPNGCTQDQVLEQLPHLPYSSVTARFRSLLDKNLIEDTGQRKPGKSGRSQRVLKAVRGVYG